MCEGAGVSRPLLRREYARGNPRTTTLDASPLGRVAREAESSYHLAATVSAAACEGRRGARFRFKVEP